MLIDRRILAGGIVLLAAGLVLSGIVGSSVPAGREGMSPEEAVDLLEAQAANRDMGTLAGILAGVGFLLILISFGARRRRRGGPKKEEKRPEAGS